VGNFRLETDRLVLRDWRRDDIAGFARVTNTPEVMRWLGGVQDAATFETMFERFDDCSREHGHCFWLVERKPGDHPLAGEILGFCGLKRGNTPGCPFMGEFEIGWRLRSDAHGQGFAREAAEASLAAGFRQFAAPRIHAITVIQNTASWGLMERLGMRRNPALDFIDSRFGPEIENVIAWTIERGEWLARREGQQA
jgi:RimJ/RimL family protein N-acetyltransferase